MFHSGENAHTWETLYRYHHQQNSPGWVIFLQLAGGPPFRPGVHIEIDTLEYQQTEKIETELKDVDRIHRIRKVYASWRSAGRSAACVYFKWPICFNKIRYNGSPLKSASSICKKSVKKRVRKYGKEYRCRNPRNLYISLSKSKACSYMPAPPPPPPVFFKVVSRQIYDG